MADIKESLELIADFLENFYRDEPDDIVAAKNAVWAGVDDRQRVWRISRAFRDVLDGELPDGVLREIIISHAKRDVWSDAEAQEYLQKIYEDTYLGDVLGFDDE